jgi:hypothetical protein
MNHRCFISVVTVVGLSALISLAQGQVPSHSASEKDKPVKQTWKVPRTPEGHPDLQGVWANNTATPMERPKELAGRTSLTDEEVAAMKKKAAELYNGKGDAAFGDTIFQSVYAAVKGSAPAAGPHVKAANEFDGGTGDYSSEWIVAREWDNRTSLLTDPPDGRLPAMTAEGLARRNASFAAMSRPAEKPADRGLQERCITFGSPQLVAGYQSYTQILQTSTSAIVLTEMIHDARIIPLDGRPHVSSPIRQWLGDSRGHWEGDTLVVETTNYKPRSFMSASSEKLRVIERFTRTGPESLKYEITIDDPGTWTKPWSLMIPLKQSSNPIFEYACHEGNVGLAGILAGARAEEQAAAAAGAGSRQPK